MRAVSSDVLAGLQKNPKNIRHICILAHVDHGKTTLADSLLASNGIISQKMAGKLRYMDSRKDEQERGITMKSSSVAVLYQHEQENFLINVIDSPGHVDFASEVCTAVRLCDGAIILIDVVEGICPQTKVALQQAWMEHIKPLLVLNKIDRLILEWKMSPLDAYFHLVQILEQINALVGELFASDILKKSDNISNESDIAEKPGTQMFDWSSGLDDSDDSLVYFSPEQGNVVFGSALDGWGFGISHFAKIYSEKLGANESILKKTLWGDFFFNSKTKQILKGAQAKAKKPLFVQLILENIWSVYDAVIVNRDKAMVEKIIKSLNLTIPPRDANHKDPKIHLQAIFSQWLPLSNAVLEMVCKFVPSPLELSEEKVEGLMCSSALKFKSLPLKTQYLKQDFLKCSASEDAPVIICVSKMFPVEKCFLPENRQRPLTAEEILIRRDKAKQRHIDKLENVNADTTSNDSIEEDKPPNELAETTDCTEGDTAFIAFARIYSGCVTKGQQLYVLGPKHDPSKVMQMDMPISDQLTVHDLHGEQHITLSTIKSIYLLMGKELIELDSAPSGNVIGIAGLQNHVLKSATLSNTIVCPSFIDLHSSTVPIVRVALEPTHPKEMPALVKGLRLLNQADPCVQVFVQETGEHVLVSSGEVHLQRCIDDLQDSFAKIKLNVSAPIVPFRETIISPPKVDMVNEIIDEKSAPKKKLSEQSICPDSEEYTIARTPNKQSSIRIHAKPLPPQVTKLLENNSALLKVIDQRFCSIYNDYDNSSLTEETIKSINDLQSKLIEYFKNDSSDWTDVCDQMWAFGPRRCGPNILLNRISSYKRPSIWTDKLTRPLKESLHHNFDSTFVSGFQLATLCGPLCDEPMMGVCFIVEDWSFDKEFSTTELNNISDDKLDTCSTDQQAGGEGLLISDSLSITSSEQSSASSTPYGPFTGQIMSTVKEACRKAFQAQPQRLMAAMYCCNIQVTMDMLGRVYAVLGRRQGRVLRADLREGSGQAFEVEAELPVVESFDFANEMRKQTSGSALPQLVFSHWEVVPVDPFWSPQTEEEYAHFGEKADVENRALKYINGVRRRKGLQVEEKIVEHAEKQRTLNKKK